jgi:hypothetical protein
MSSIRMKGDPEWPGNEVGNSDRLPRSKGFKTICHFDFNEMMMVSWVYTCQNSSNYTF